MAKKAGSKVRASKTVATAKKTKAKKTSTRKGPATAKSRPSIEQTQSEDAEEAVHANAIFDLPFDGELVRAANKRFEETIVFIPHFGGSKKTVFRHLALVNQLGFDAVRFNLIFNDVKPMQRLPITADLRFGTRHVWTEQIESILNAIPGRKIIYSFSMPSSSALDAISRRQAHDVAGWICDGGPFLDLANCTWNLYTYEYEVRSRVLRGVFSGLSMVLFGLGLEQEIPSMMRRIPRDFPVLSIRGWKDPLVPPSAIEAVFRHQDHLDLEHLELAEGKHLDGLKFFADQYRPRIERFLLKCAHRLFSTHSVTQ